MPTLYTLYTLQPDMQLTLAARIICTQAIETLRHCLDTHLEPFKHITHISNHAGCHRKHDAIQFLNKWLREEEKIVAVAAS